MSHCCSTACRYIRYFLLLVGVLSFNAANAEDAYDEDLEGLLSLSIKELLSVTVQVASNNKEPAMLAPSSVTVFERSQILEMGVRSVEELLNFVPGFQTSRVTFLNQGYRVSARGLVTGQPSYSVLFLMDGQRMNSDMSGGAMFDNRFITTANIERVEVIRGPGSAIYGSGAFSGVVNIITTKDTNDAYVAAGDFGSREFYTNGSVASDAWKASGFVRFYKDEGLNYGPELTTQIDPSTASTQDPYSALDGKTVISWEDRIQLDVRHSSRKLDDFFNFNFVQNGTTQAETEQNSISLSGDVIQSSTWRLAANMNYSEWKESQVEEFSTELGEYQFYSSEWSFGLKAHSRVNKHELMVGMDYHSADIDRYQFVSSESNAVYRLGPNSGREIFQFFSRRINMGFSESIHGTLGMRIDKNE